MKTIAQLLGTILGLLIAMFGYMTVIGDYPNVAYLLGAVGGIILGLVARGQVRDK